MVWYLSREVGQINQMEDTLSPDTCGHLIFYKDLEIDPGINSAASTNRAIELNVCMKTNTDRAIFITLHKLEQIQFFHVCVCSGSNRYSLVHCFGSLL